VQCTGRKQGLPQILLHNHPIFLMDSGDVLSNSSHLLK
jgi:hypothetical protein